MTKSKKSERKKQKQQQRKRLLERRRRPLKVQPVNARHRQRIAEQNPRGWSGETVEDVAVFDDEALHSLLPEVAIHVATVREALTSACESRGDEALKRVAGIPRSSPLSQWRLFIRGLVPWLVDDTEAAKEVWSRLDPERRPGRIAVSMTAALRTDLDTISCTRVRREPVNREVDAPKQDLCQGLDTQLLYHAKLLRRIRFDRAAIRVAEAGVRTPEESKNLKLGPKKIKWLQNFATEYRPTEPDLVAALEQVALRRAFSQDFGDVFEIAIKAFVGPRHDRRNSLLSFFYYVRFEKDHDAHQKADKSIHKYLTRDLAQNNELSDPLRNTIVSQVHLNEAMALVRPTGRGLLDFMFDGPEDSDAIKHHFQASVRAFPANRFSHKAHAEWIESKLDNDRLTKAERKPLESQLAEVMKMWSDGLPGDVEPRLWLVDHLLEHEETEEAKPHVDWLAAARHDDPRVRATPWKWQLLEAMRLSRRKTWLAKVPSRLEEAELLWPTWLSKQWLPYLHAAWSLRCGMTDKFEECRAQICNESGIVKGSLADACMMLGAAQHMRASSAQLKPLRAAVDQALKNIAAIPYNDLLLAGEFFWDLNRTRLLYPAYRMHAVKFMKELFDRLKNNAGLALNHIDNERLHAAVLVCSEHRILSDGYRLTLPAWYSTPAVQKHPMFVAAEVNAFLKLRYQRRDESLEGLGSLLRAAARSLPDLYYRHWLASLSDQLDELPAKNDSTQRDFGFNPFDAMFATDDEWDDSLDFDPDCDCAECQSAKRAYEASL